MLSTINIKSLTNPDIRSHYFMDKSDIITLKKGIKCVVSNEYEGDYDRFLMFARRLFEIEEIKSNSNNDDTVNNIFLNNTHQLDNVSTPDLKNESKRIKKSKHTTKFSVKIGDIIKLYPSHMVGVVVNLYLDQNSHKKIVVQLDNSSTKVIEDKKYFFKKLYGKEKKKYAPETSEDEINMTNPRQTAEIGDWIKIEGVRPICQVIGKEKFGSYMERLIIQFNDGRQDWIIDGQDNYSIRKAIKDSL